MDGRASSTSIARALRLPFQFTSVLFVATTSLLLAYFLDRPFTNPAPAAIGLWFGGSWLHKYALALLEHAANGHREAPVASVEMLGPFGGARAWVHPVLVGAIALLAWWLGEPWRLIAGLLGAVLLPASVAAVAMSGRPADAVDPRALWSVLRGLGPWYLLILAAALALGGLVWLLLRVDVSLPLRLAVVQLALLTLASLLGGLLHARRLELDFEPVHSPERIAERAEEERRRQRQAVVDEFYGAIRAREPTRATAAVERWLALHPGSRAAGDAGFFIEQAQRWPGQAGLATLLRALISHALRTRQGGLAVLAVEKALQCLPGFAPRDTAELEALDQLVRGTGRRRLAETLAENFARGSGAPQRP